MDRPFSVENAGERERLRALVGRLTDEELTLSMANGWTVAVALAHLAFWDHRTLLLLQRWRSGGVKTSPIDADLTNDALLPLWLALPPRAAARLAVSSAEALDRELEEYHAELISAIEAAGEKSRLYRAPHRRAHLDEVEKALKNRRAA